MSSSSRNPSRSATSSTSSSGSSPGADPPVGRQAPDHFSDRADDYLRFRPRYPAVLADYLREVAGGRDLVWEAGCGSGQLTELLPDRFDRVVGTDRSREQVLRAPAHPRVVLRAAPAERSGLPDDAADLAVAAQAAHWFPLGGYYAEVSRVVRPGGAVALVTYGFLQAEEPIQSRLRRFHDEVLAAHWPTPRRHVDAGYRSLPFPFAALAAPDLTMREDWHLDQLLGYVRTWSAVRGLELAEGRAVLDPLRSSLAEVWGPSESRRPIHWPLAIRAGRV